MMSWKLKTPVLTSASNLSTQLYDKRDSFSCYIVKSPCLCINIASSPAYDMYTMYIAADSVCKSLFDIRSVFDSKKCTNKQVDVTGFIQFWLQESFRKFYNRYNDLVCQYNLSLGQILSDMFHTNH
jgi:hypothetical protein